MMHLRMQNIHKIKEKLNIKAFFANQSNIFFFSFCVHSLLLHEIGKDKNKGKMSTGLDEKKKK